MSPLTRAMRRLAPPPLRALWEKHLHPTPLRLGNAVLNKLEMRLGRTHLISRPYKLCIEVNSRCNLRCPLCPTGLREEGRPLGDISYDVFESIVAELGDYAFSLDLFNWGEALFHADLPRLLRCASRKRLATTIASNLSFRLKDDAIRSIISSGLTYLTGSIDGADQASYEVYRRGGRFELAVESLERFVRLKRELRSELPHVRWQYLVFPHNEDGVEEARRRAREIGVDSFIALEGVHDDADWKSRDPHSADYLKLHRNRCVWLWNTAVFHIDGALASCEMGYDPSQDFAQWKSGTFGQMWNNEKFTAARRIWTEPRSSLPGSHFCTGCARVQFYRGLPQDGRGRVFRRP
jgi:MoaA/NifB/PqqE/SkfB family radical SAM enzyme